MISAITLLALAQAPPALVLTPIFDARLLPLAEQPTYLVGLVTRPGDDRMFLLDAIGDVRIVRDGTLLPAAFVDVRAQATMSYGGPMAMTFHPAFDSNGFLYLWYGQESSAGVQDMVLARITVDANNPDRTDPSTLVELLRVPWDFRQHWGGSMEFGPDGMLWLGTGDGGLGQDPQCRAQDMSLLTGKMIRIDVDSAFPYAIPPDNPYVGMSGVAPEIVFSGLRHPWKWSFDEATGDLWIGDVGQWDREEVNFVEAGRFDLNFGWSREEGTDCYLLDACSAVPPPCGAPELRDPLYEYPHENLFGCAITGGYVYRGTRIPELFGTYVCTDSCTSRFWGIRRNAQGGIQVYDDLEVRFTQIATNTPMLVSFAVARDGELLLADLARRSIYRIERDPDVATTCEGALNSVGAAGSLRWDGSTSIASSDAKVTLSSLPPSSTALLFYGPTGQSVPVGNGTLCVGGTLSRVGTRTVNPIGQARFGLDFSVPPFRVGPGILTAGATHIFQGWYRDVGGPLGATFNFTGAQAVTFRP